MKHKQKCIARGQSTQFCDGCKRQSSKCPQRDKYRDFRNCKKGAMLYGEKTGYEKGD